jgi:pimeloyl-ACP methyl ester carboxylesterase
VLTSSAIRRDTVRVLRGITAEPRLPDQAADKLRGFYRPVLVAWAAEDRVVPPEHGRRLAGMLPNARLDEIPDSLVPLDQPTALAHALSVFLSATVPPTAGAR